MKEYMQAVTDITNISTYLNGAAHHGWRFVAILRSEGFMLTLLLERDRV
jgi:hypothetical protein